MKKLTLTKQEELFAKDCKLINLRYEYYGYTGTEKWAIVTELAEEELWAKYPDVIGRYTPFILLSMAQGEVIKESNSNNDKYAKRAKRTLDAYGYEDDISEQFHLKTLIRQHCLMAVHKYGRIQTPSLIRHPNITTKMYAELRLALCLTTIT